jgi:hypothetical protein
MSRILAGMKKNAAERYLAATLVRGEVPTFRNDGASLSKRKDCEASQKAALKILLRKR